ncbi:MAG: Molybdopterin molybdenumtransferase [Syntrophorhabdus sp. PtaU1.Bin058]|nr:MAG: Molybdopterin molybdenumtransferase [Syntrophorhabdus sp. PtaU1.Bin058]
MFIARDLIMGNKNFAVSVEEAQKIILDSVRPLDYESISIIEASRRVLYEDIVSDIMIPPMDDSAMDGYAIIADDTKGATKEKPVSLKVTGEIQAGGSIVGKKVSKGTAIRIMTGAPIPEGADSVVRFEDTKEEAGYVKIFCDTAKYNNYRFAGENIKKEDRVLCKGDRLRSADIGVLASLNYDTVRVYKQPTVAIISTGDELARVGETLQAGQIRNVNAYTLYSEVKRYSGIPDYLGIAKDTLKDMKEIFLKALKYDVVISTGGVSAGRYDFVKEIYSDLNIEIQFERVNIKPGRPFVFGKKDNKLFFGLPGNPVPTLTSFIQFVRPALLRLMGATRIQKPIVNAFLEGDIRSIRAYHLVRGYFTVKNNEFYVLPTGNQKPSVLRSMSDANCLIVVPEDVTKVKAGEKVAIQLIDHDEIG